RLIFSAFCSGLIATIFYHSYIGALASFILLIGLAFSFRIQTLIKQGTVLLITSFFLGCLLTSLLTYLFNQSDVTFFIFCISITVLSLTMLHSKWRKMMQEKVQQSFVVHCELELFEQTYFLKGYVDTGNECVEPLSGKPVHFLSYKAVAEQLPRDFHEALMKWDEKNPYELS